MPMLPEITSTRKWLLLAAIFLVLSIMGAFIILDPVSSSCPLLSDSILEYQKYLKEYYGEYDYPLYSKPVFSTNENRPKQPINIVLFLKEKNETDSSYIELQQLLTNGSVNELKKLKQSIRVDQIGSRNGKNKAAKFVLIEGGPGMGKSTLCWQLCRLWREGKLQWDLMVIVELRDESTRRASSLYDLLYHPDDETRLAIEQDIKKREGEGLLIFLDGYDELSNEQQNELSLVHKILTNKLLRKATVVVTSRPHAIERLPSQFKQGLNQHIAIAGFNETDIHAYTTLACKDNQDLLEDLRSYVDSHPFILSVMYNPLHCSIVTELYIQYWQNGPRRGFAPQTLTELYNALLLNILRRYLPSNQTQNFHDLSDLSQDVYTNLMQLAEVAAQGLQKRQFMFTNLSCASLGLMKSVRKLYDIRAKQPAVHTFLHLTLQEYLAALYWSEYRDRQPKTFLDSEIRNCMSIKMPNSELHRPFCLFFAGLTKKKIDIEQTKQMKYFFIPQMCEMLFEAQSSDLLFNGSTVMLPATNTGNFSQQFVNDLIEAPLTSFATAYCFVRNSDSTSTWILTINERNHLQRLADGMHSAYRDETWKEKDTPSLRLHLTHNINDILEVFPRLYPFTKSITQLNLSGDLNEKGTLIMKKLSYYCPKLASLLITRKSFRPDVFQLPKDMDLTRVTVFLPSDEKLLHNLHLYQAVTELRIWAERRYVCCFNYKRSLFLYGVIELKTQSYV